MLVYLFNQGFEHSESPRKFNSQSENALRSRWAPSFALSPICECKRWSPMTPKSNTLSWPHGPLHSHLVANPILRLRQFLLSFYLFTLFVVLCANHAVVVFTIGLLIVVTKWNYNSNKSKRCASYNHRPLVEKTSDVNAKATRLKLNVT